MELRIKTYGLPVAVDVWLHSENFQEVEIYAKHPTYINTCYTQRVVKFKGNHHVKLLLPVSHEKGVIVVARNNKTKKSTVKISRYQLSHLETKISVLPKDNKYLFEFINHAIDFCSRASFLPTGNYNSKNIRITYVDSLKVKNDEGKMVQSTSPARVNSHTKIIEVSKAFFKNRTIAGRFAVVCHEFAHVYMNNVTSSEFEADKNAAMIYLGLGFPRADLITVWADIYSAFDTKQNRQRMERYMSYVKSYDKL